MFPTVCGDFAFYQFPTPEFWAKLLGRTPAGFQWGLKVPEQVTVPRWPTHARYGALAGQDNPLFLDWDLFESSFLQALEPHQDRVGVLIFEFGTFRRRAIEDAAQFVKAFAPFLERLPAKWRCAVEVRNAEFLRPEYFDCLRAFNVAHVYNAWSRMPQITEQMAIPESRTADMLVARALLRRGRPYEQAVRMFSPYEQVQDVNEGVREALRELIDIALVDGQPAFIFVNNRLEGNSPGTIVAITE